MLALQKFSLFHMFVVYAVQFSSVAQSCPALCDPMDCSTPGLPVHHLPRELTQTHVHWVSDAIQPSYPLLSPSPPVFYLSQHQSLSNESALSIRWPKYWSFSFSISPFEYSGLISFNWLTGLISFQSKLVKPNWTTFHIRISQFNPSFLGS